MFDLFCKLLLRHIALILTSISSKYLKSSVFKQFQVLRSYWLTWSFRLNNFVKIQFANIFLDYSCFSLGDVHNFENSISHTPLGKSKDEIRKCKGTNGNGIQSKSLFSKENKGKTPEITFKRHF